MCKSVRWRSYLGWGLVAADMAKASMGNSSGQGSGRAPTAIPSLGPAAIGPSVGLPQGHPGLTNWYMNQPPSMHEQLLPSQVSSCLSGL